MTKPYANRLDCLEIAFERNSMFEQRLANASKQSSTDVEELWEGVDFLKGSDTALPSETKELLELLPSFTIGQWEFRRGIIPGNNSPYKYNYEVRIVGDEVEGLTTSLGYLYFETYLLRRDNIYLKLNNYLLYNEEALWERLKQFKKDFSLSFRHVSKVDIALDGVVNTSQYIYNLMKRDKSVNWVINGRVIKDRDATIKRLFFVVNGSLNNPDKNKNLYVKQSEGQTLNCYDKTAEIVEKSCKYYQVGDLDWDFDDDGQFLPVADDKIYRNEIRMSRKNIDNYRECKHLTDEEFFSQLRSERERNLIFEDISQRMIRWHRGRRSYNMFTLIRDGNSALHNNIQVND